MGKFKPNMYYKSIFDINYDLIKEKEIKVLIFDLDNTIMTYDQELPNDKVKELFNKLKKEFKVFIASNNLKDRVQRIGKYLNVHAFYSVGKPTKRLKKLLLRECDIEMPKVAIIGDQIVTDIYMGNRLEMNTILVDPMGQKDLKITFLNRAIEKVVMKRIKLKRGEYYEEIL